MRSLVKSNKGQELVEYALIAPLLILLLLGIMEFAMVILSYNTIANVAREGARFAVAANNQDQIDGSASELCSAASNGIIATACSTALSLDPSRVRISTTLNSDVYQDEVFPVIDVQVTYTHTLMTNPIVTALGGTSALPLQAGASMRLE